MKTDRELLELAAKAAGLRVYVWGDSGQEKFALADDPNLKLWNPLTDDGDALRLAVKLKFAVNVWSGCSVMTGAALNATCVLEDVSNDPYAATRRAIVRAAAEIGEAQRILEN